jgi:hypothetical protein
MRAQLRPLVELLEGRMLLSTGNVLFEDAPEHLQFVAPGTNASGVHAAVSQQAGSVTLTLTLTRSTNVYGVKYKGSVQVEVATGPLPPPYTPAGSAQPEVSSENWALRRGPATSVPPATPGVQYQTVDETITFPPGVNAEPVTIPIVAGAANPGMLSFQVTATQVGVQTNPDGTVPAGLQTAEDVFIAGNTGAPVPRIDGARMVANGHNTSEFVLHFSQPMDPASVQNRAVYSLTDHSTHAFGGFNLFGSWGVGMSSTSVVLKKAVYNPSSNTVRLILAKPVPASDGYQISQPFATSDELRDAAGTPINEDGSGYGGGFMITLTSKKATIFDGVSQSVVPANARRR